MPQPSSQSGSTLIEVIVAMTIMVLGLTAMLSLAIASLAMSRATKERVVALNLAREGIELTRAVRDTNWLRDDRCWNADTPPDPALPMAEDYWYCGLQSGFWLLDYSDQDSLGTPALATSPITAEDQIGECANCALVQNPDSDPENIRYGHIITVPGRPIIYRRLVHIESADPTDPSQIKKVTSIVWWTEKNRPHILKLETYLTNWR